MATIPHYDPEYYTYADECHNRNAGYQATWRLTPPAPVPPRPVRPPVAYHAHYDGQYGTALRDAAGAVWFVHEDDGSLLLLHDCDAPLLLLHGQLALEALQQVQDDLAGGLLTLVDQRQSEHARGAA